MSEQIAALIHNIRTYQQRRSDAQQQLSGETEHLLQDIWLAEQIARFTACLADSAIELAEALEPQAETE